MSASVQRRVVACLYFILSRVDAPHRKVWALNCLERSRINLTFCRHLRRPLVFPVPEVANIALYDLTAGVGVPGPAAAAVGRNPDVRSHDDGEKHRQFPKLHVEGG